MALRAMGLIALPLTYIAKVAALTINLMCNGLKVAGSHTGGRPAQMVKFKTLWDSPKFLFIAPSVGKDNPSRFIGTTTDSEHAVPITDVGGSPEPTTIGLINLRPESLMNGHFGLGHMVSPKIGICPV